MRRAGDVVAHVGHGAVEARLAHRLEDRLRRVGVALLLADVAHEPRIERAAVNLVGDVQHRPARIVAANREVADRDRRLHAVRAAARTRSCGLRAAASARLGGGGTVPRVQSPNAFSAAANAASGRHVAGDDHERVVRPVIASCGTRRSTRDRSCPPSPASRRRASTGAVRTASGDRRDWRQTAATPAAPAAPAPCSPSADRSRSCGNVGLRTTSASSVSIAGSVSASPRIVNDEVSCPAAAVSVAPIAKISCRIWRLSRVVVPSCTASATNCARPAFSAGSTARPGLHRQHRRHLRHGGVAHRDDAQTVRQRPLDARRRRERPLGADGRPRRRLRLRDGGERQKQRRRSREDPLHVASSRTSLRAVGLAAGRLSIDVWLVWTNQRPAAAFTSSTVTLSSSVENRVDPLRVVVEQRKRRRAGSRGRSAA